jgi:hypothetical protein
MPSTRHVQHDESEDPEARKVLAEVKGQLGHHRSKEQVIKQLQPGGVPFSFGSLTYAKPRRLPQDSLHSRLSGWCV